MKNAALFLTNYFRWASSDWLVASKENKRVLQLVGGVLSAAFAALIGLRQPEHTGLDPVAHLAFGPPKVYSADEKEATFKDLSEAMTRHVKSQIAQTANHFGAHPLGTPQLDTAPITMDADLKSFRSGVLKIPVSLDFTNSTGVDLHITKLVISMRCYDGAVVRTIGNDVLEKSHINAPKFEKISLLKDEVFEIKQWTPFMVYADYRWMRQMLEGLLDDDPDLQELLDKRILSMIDKFGYRQIFGSDKNALKIVSGQLNPIVLAAHIECATGEVIFAEAKISLDTHEGSSASESIAYRSQAEARFVGRIWFYLVAPGFLILCLGLYVGKRSLVLRSWTMVVILITVVILAGSLSLGFMIQGLFSAWAFSVKNQHFLEWITRTPFEVWWWHFPQMVGLAGIITGSILFCGRTRAKVFWTWLVVFSTLSLFDLFVVLAWPTKETFITGALSLICNAVGSMVLSFFALWTLQSAFKPRYRLSYLRKRKERGQAGMA